MTVRFNVVGVQCGSRIDLMTEAQLRAFVAVAECGNFGAAAKRLHMSQPGVSRAVRALEHELGGELLVRGPGTLASLRSASGRWCAVVCCCVKPRRCVKNATSSSVSPAAASD